MQNDNLEAKVEETLEQAVKNEVISDELDTQISEENLTTKEVVEKTDEDIDNVDNHETVPSNTENVDSVESLVEQAREIVKEADTQLNEVKEKVKADLEKYEYEKKELKSIVIDVNNALVKQIDYQQEHLEELEAQEEGTQYGDELEALENIEESIEVLKDKDFMEAEAYNLKDNIPPMYIEEPSSGKFGGFMMGLIGGGATFAGMAYFASTKLGINLDPSKMPNLEQCKPVFEYYSKLVGQAEPGVGMGVMGVSALLVMWIIYTIRKSTKATKNLEFVKEQLAKANSYAQEKLSMANELEKIDQHLNDAVEIFKLYGVILNEQKAKLNRIMYIEADKIASGNLHEKSLQEIEDTRNLVEAFKEYLATSLVDENGQLSVNITKAMSDMKENADKLVNRLY